MANITKRGSGYRVRWRDPDGRERTRQCPDHETAKTLKRDVEQNVARGERWEPRDVRPLPDIEEILKAYSRECARVLKPNVAVWYARGMEMFLRFLRAREGHKVRLMPDLLTRNLLAEFYEDLATGGLHGRNRAASTRRKIVEIIQLAWAWAWDDDTYGEFVPRPRRLRMPREEGSPTVAPTWAEMDACIQAANIWYRELAIVLRFTGLRVQQAMFLTWDDVELDRCVLRIRGELGKSRQERQGRVIPVSQHLAAEVAGWGRRDGWLINSTRQRGGPRERQARATYMRQAWVRAGVRPNVCKQPHHCFRKGLISELKRAGADVDAVEYLVGHSLGLRGVYTDPDALPLREVVDLIPPIGGAGEVVSLEKVRDGS